MIYHPTTPLEAVTLRKQNADTAVYLAGGTDDLRLNGSAPGRILLISAPWGWTIFSCRTASSISAPAAPLIRS